MMSKFNSQTVFCTLFCFACFFLGVGVTVAQETTVYLVRHTEKDLTQKSDPPLTETGKARAQQWAKILQYEKIVAVFSTDTIRTRDTAAPIAEKHAVAVTLYPADSVSRDDFLQAYVGKALVIVGHSNTVPGIVNMLVGEERFGDLNEGDYDSLFIVNIPADAAQASASSKQLTVPLSK